MLANISELGNNSESTVAAGSLLPDSKFAIPAVITDQALGFGFRLQGLGFRVWGLGIGV